MYSLIQPSGSGREFGLLHGISFKVQSCLKRKLIVLNLLWCTLGSGTERLTYPRSPHGGVWKC